MFERDYLMRILAALGEAIRRSIDRAGDADDPESSAELLELALGESVDMDSSLFLSLAPDSLPTMLDISGTDPKAVAFMARSLLLASQYRMQAGQTELASLRLSQAYALSDAYGLDLQDSDIEYEELDRFLSDEGC